MNICFQGINLDAQSFLQLGMFKLKSIGRSSRRLKTWKEATCIKKTSNRFFSDASDSAETDKPQSLPPDYVVPNIWIPPSNETMGKFGAINSDVAGPRYEKQLPKGKHDLQLYSLGTPNGQKVTIMLEELGVDYDAWKISIAKLEHFSTGFVELNPNSKIPALYDYGVPEDQLPVRIFESGSILLYLSEKFDWKFIPKDKHRKADCISWLMWQMGSAPVFGGGFGHFYVYSPMKIKYCIDRYTMEVKRLLDVLDRHLGSVNTSMSPKSYMCGDEYTIADMAIFPWVRVLETGYNAETFLQTKKYRYVEEWKLRIMERKPVKRGLRINTSIHVRSDAVPERHSRDDFNADDY